MYKVAFSANSPNFWANLLIMVLGLLALIGVKFPQDPTSLSTDIVTTLGTRGYFAVVTILATSVLMPIYNFFIKRPKISLVEFFGSPNTWVYIASFLVSVLVLFGVNVPDGTAESIVGAVFAKDWAGLAFLVVANLLNPIIRWLRTRGSKIAAKRAEKAKQL